MPDRPEIRRDEEGALDEIVASGCSFHLEQMAEDQWWMSIQSGGVDVHVTLYRKGKCIRASVQEMRNA